MSPADLGLALSTVAGSTTHKSAEFAEWAQAQAAAHAGRQLGGQKGSRWAQERSEALRSAILQAAGLEPMRGGLRPGELLQPVPVDSPQWPVKIIRRIAANPQHFGVDKPPCDRLVREVWMEQRRKLAAI